jgi:hypothetical protein
VWPHPEAIEGKGFETSITFNPYINSCSHQEDFYAFATLSLDPEELRISVKKSLGIDWDPTLVGDVFSRQVVFVGIYDGKV